MKTKKHFHILISYSLICFIFVPLLCLANVKSKNIALTFDDGPSDIYTPQVLAILEWNQIKATFFVMGMNVKKHPEIVQKVYADGNDIGNHTYSHPNLAHLSESAIANELIKASEQIHKAIHKYPILMRPPYGMSSSLSNQVIAKLGYRKITWDYMINDYEPAKLTSEIIAKNVIAHARPGAIITMHDCCANRAKTVEALPIIISTLKKEGYKFVTVSELLNIKPYRSDSNK